MELIEKVLLGAIILTGAVIIYAVIHQVILCVCLEHKTVMVSHPPIYMKMGSILMPIGGGMLEENQCVKQQCDDEGK